VSLCRGRGVYLVDGCHESSYVVQAALEPLGIEVRIESVLNHRTAFFPLLKLALFHGDDVHNGAPFELAPMAAVERYHRALIDVPENLARLPRSERTEELRELFLEALAGQSFPVPGQGGESFEVPHAARIGRVAPEVLWAIARVSDQLPNRSLELTLDYEDQRSAVSSDLRGWAAKAFGDWFDEYEGRLDNGIRPPEDGVARCRSDAFTLHVSPEFGLAESADVAIDLLVRWVEAVAAHGAVASGLIPDARLRQEARRDPGEAP
jgi:hypothetical protein